MEESHFRRSKQQTRLIRPHKSETEGNMLLQHWEIDSGRPNKSWTVANDKSYTVAGTNPHLPVHQNKQYFLSESKISNVSISNTRVARCLVRRCLHLVKQISGVKTVAWNCNLTSVYTREGAASLGGLLISIQKYKIQIWNQIQMKSRIKTMDQEIYTLAIQMSLKETIL